MTESNYYNNDISSNCNNKKFGFVVDINISRMLNTCITYNTIGFESKDLE